jgi:hypothetical protein
VRTLLEHPMISEMNRKGFIGEKESINCGSDYFGFEILAGDEVIEYDGEIVLKENLVDYLKEMGFEFKKAE